MPRGLLNPEFEPGAPPPRWARRWRFLALLVVAGIGWLIAAAIVYLAFGAGRAMN